MKGWKDIAQDLMQAFFANSDEVRMGIDRPAVANVLKELITQFKEVYEIDGDEDRYACGWNDCLEKLKLRLK